MFKSNFMGLLVYFVCSLFVNFSFFFNSSYSSLAQLGSPTHLCSLIHSPIFIYVGNLIAKFIYFFVFLNVLHKNDVDVFLTNIFFLKKLLRWFFLRFTILNPNKKSRSLGLKFRFVFFCNMFSNFSSHSKDF